MSHKLCHIRVQHFYMMRFALRIQVDQNVLFCQLLPKLSKRAKEDQNMATQPTRTESQNIIEPTPVQNR